MPSPAVFCRRGSGKAVLREPGKTLIGFLYGVQTTFVSEFRLRATEFPKIAFCVKQKDVCTLAKHSA